MDTDAKREYLRKWREAHREQQREYFKQYNEENHEKLAEQKRIYYRQHKQEFLDRAAKAYEENPEAVKERASKWNKAHPERRHVISAKWSRENPEAKQAACKRFRERHRAYHLARIRAWRDANPDKVLRYRESHSEEIAERSRKWAKANPDKRRLHAHNRRVKLNGAGGSYTLADIERLYAYQCGRCAACLRELHRKFEIDHRMPVHLGGSNWPDNLQLLCMKCNRRKGHKHPDTWTP